MFPLLHAALAVGLLLGPTLAAPPANAAPAALRGEWPQTDFGRHSVPLEEITSGGPPKDGIPSIDEPSFVPVAQADLPPQEPVMGLVIGGDARAYPLRILMWHEIVNDVVEGMPVAVTYCPLCNTGLVFDRRVDGRTLEFGTTGKLRHSDLVMYDRETESWWQQFLGEAIVGEMTGARLDLMPARLESFENFARRAPAGKVLVPNDPRMRAYGHNPYGGYDGAPRPFLYHGEMPEGIEPLARVVRVDDEAWSLALLRAKGEIEAGDLRLTWEPGQASALDTGEIAKGRDVGNVVVQRRSEEGWTDVPYSVDFAFAFHAFYPEGTIHMD